MHLNEQLHQRQVPLGLRHRFVVEPAARDPDQFALPTEAQLFAWRNQFLPRDYRPNCLHFFLSQSTSTLSCPIFSCNCATNSWRSSPAACGASNNSGRRSRTTPFHCVTCTG